MFAISHDDRYYGVADRVVKLDYGQVVHDSAAPGLLFPGASIVDVPAGPGVAVPQGA